MIAAALSSVMNKKPPELIGALSIDAAHATGAVRKMMIYANMIDGEPAAVSAGRI